MFITLEGIDRAGKSTQAELLAAALGPDTLSLREPGGTESGERMRELLKSPDLRLDPRAELLLFCAARAQLVAEVIEPARAAGRDIVCDRFVDSSIAYQGAGRGLGAEAVRQACAVAVGECMPELTFLLRVDPERAASRGQLRAAEGIEDGTDRFEAEGMELQRRVAAAYGEIAAAEPTRFVIVDAEGDPGEVHAELMAAVEARR